MRKNEQKKQVQFFKKITIYFLVFAILCGCMVGCDNDKKKENDAKTETGKEVEKDKEEWKYDFLYGGETVSAQLLTNFNDGKRGKAGYGFASFSEEGMLVKTVSGYAKVDAIYSGANLLSADYTKTKYLGIMLENKDSVNAFLGLSAVDNAGKKIHFLQEGSAIALSSDDGMMSIAEGQNNTDGMYCISIPAYFSGSVLVPVDRIAMDESAWDKTPIEKIGFQLSSEGAAGVLIKTVFLCNSELAEPKAGTTGGSENIPTAEYSYTDDQRIAPFWENNIMYNETMTMVKKSDNEIYGTLLFIPTQIIAIKDTYLNKTYVEGIDWEWEKGTNKIKWLKGSSIQYFTENDLSGKNADGSYIPDNTTTSDGRSRYGNCLACGSKFFFEKQISVSYTYSKKQVEARKIQYTEYQGDKLTKTVSKLKSNENLKVLFYGDSIFSGAESSSMANRAPYMPDMHELIQARLQKETSGKVTVDNIAVGGWTSLDGLNALSGIVQGRDYSNSFKGYDLLIISFGMNDIATTKSKYVSNMKGIVDKIKAANPNLEVILVSCMNPNPRAASFCGNQKRQGDWLREIAAENTYSSYTAVVDIYAVHNSILKYKAYSSTTSDNIHHPSDWLIRVYAQNILAAILE